MSRPVSVNFKRALHSQYLGDAFLVLLTIDHVQLAQPIRVTSDSSPMSSGGQTFQPYAFSIGLPDERLGVLPEMSLQIDNVDQVLVQAVRTLGDAPPTLRFQIVLASNPNVVEVDIDELEIVNVEYDQFLVSARITQNPMMDIAFPGDRYTPQSAPGLFRD